MTLLYACHYPSRWRERSSEGTVIQVQTLTLLCVCGVKKAVQYITMLE